MEYRFDQALLQHHFLVLFDHFVFVTGVLDQTQGDEALAQYRVVYFIPQWCIGSGVFYLVSTVHNASEADGRNANTANQRAGCGVKFTARRLFPQLCQRVVVRIFVPGQKVLKAPVHQFGVSGVLIGLRNQQLQAAGNVERKRHGRADHVAWFLTDVINFFCPVEVAGERHHLFTHQSTDIKCRSLHHVV